MSVLTGAARDLMPEHHSTDRIQTATSKTFDSLITEGAGPIAVEFMSYGCEHCREIEPVLQKVAEMVKAKEKIFRVNTGADQELANRYEISGTPTIVMFLGGKEVGRVEGPSPEVSSVLAAVTQPYETRNELAS